MSNKPTYRRDTMQMSSIRDCKRIRNRCSTQHLQPRTAIWWNDLAFLTADRTTPVWQFMRISHYFKLNGIPVAILHTDDSRLTTTQKVMAMMQTVTPRLVAAVRTRTSPCCAWSVCFCFHQLTTGLYPARCYRRLPHLYSAVDASAIPDLQQRPLTTWSSERNPLVSRGASVRTSLARHAEDVPSKVAEEAAKSSHDGFFHKITDTRVTASQERPVAGTSVCVFLEFNAQGL
jgi:hypothetical protein